MTATTDWKLKEPDIALTPAEREWYEWASSGAREVIDDPDWLADNEDALTVAGQLKDMRYRLSDQADDMIDAESLPIARASRRVLNSLNVKLTRCGYWTDSYHAT